jgi:hypothetical protein
VRLLRGFAGLPPAMSDRPIRSGPAATEDERTLRRRFILVVFMRCLACVWLAQALLQWIAVLTAEESGLDPARIGWRVALVVFAVLDPLAAVGLWLATAWGGVVWLFAAAVQIITAVAIPGFFSPLWIGVDGLLVGIYVLLRRLAAERPRARRARA